MKYAMHGLRRTPEYQAYYDMRSRCLNRANKYYKHYGGRGIRVCERWMDSVENFYADMGPRPGKGYSLDRIDNDGDYSPENCRWATIEQQARNTSRTRIVEVNGMSMCVRDWEKVLGMGHGTIQRRIESGMPPVDAVTKPKSVRRKLPQKRGPE